MATHLDASGLYSGNVEPTINEMLRDSITHLLMARDGIGASEVLAVVERTKTALRDRDWVVDQVL
jgi:hypothetical protein